MQCKVKRPNKCAGGEHAFIVSRWHIVSGMQSSAGYTCQHCLLSVDGKADIDMLRNSVHDTKKVNRENSITANAVQDDQGSSREKQKTD